MGNLNVQNFCDCDYNDSKIEASFKSNQNADNIFCPFINYDYEKRDNNKNEIKNKKKKSIFDFNDCEMNFEYHTTKPNVLKDTNKPYIPNKSFFNLNSNREIYDINILNDINNNNSNNNNEEDNTNNNKIITLESDNYKDNKNCLNLRNQNELEKEEKINTNKNLKSKEMTSNNSDNSNIKTNIKTNIDKAKKKKKNGFHIQIWSKNHYYIGYYEDDMADGLGKMITGNNKYYGEFKNGQSNGFGIFYNNINEIIYEGYWLNDLQNEYGLEKWNDDSIFFGNYSQGEKNGIGCYLWKDGSIYEGEFCNNKFEGYGIYYYNNNKIYLGEWKNNKKNGYGELIAGDRLYVGNYLNDHKNGFGISYWKNEDKLYVGFWKNNKKNGFGKFFHENKVRFGIWDYENEKLKIEWFKNDEEAFNYLENNNLGKYKTFFENDKDEIIINLNKYYKENFSIPCSIPDILLYE